MNPLNPLYISNCLRQGKPVGSTIRDSARICPACLLDRQVPDRQVPENLFGQAKISTNNFQF